MAQTIFDKPVGTEISTINGNLASKLDKSSAGLKVGTNTCSNIILPGYITGSRKYVGTFLPVNTSQISGITSAVATFTMYSQNNGAESHSSKTASINAKQAFGVQLEFPIAEMASGNQNRPCTLFINSITIVCT